jgi:hypothetical protein
LPKIFVTFAQASFHVWVCFEGKLKNHKCDKVAIRLFEEIRLKSLGVSLVLTIFVASFLCMGFAAALSQDEASVHTFFNPQTLTPGQPVTVNIAFTSNSSDALVIERVGLNFDWMGTNDVVGVDLTNQPVPVTAGSTAPTVLPQMLVNIPANVTLGIHSYTVIIDGTQGASATAFSWVSPQASIAVIGNNGQTAGPTVTSAPTGGGGAPSGQPDLQLYGAIGAVVVIVVLLVIVLVLRRKKAKPQNAPNQTASKPEGPNPEQKPEEKPSPEKQDFDI